MDSPSVQLKGTEVEKGFCTRPERPQEKRREREREQGNGNAASVKTVVALSIVAERSAELAGQ